MSCFDRCDRQYWLALNRYGLHQIIDFILYQAGYKDPAKPAKGQSNYLQDLGHYTSKSLHTSEASPRARDHVALHASIVLLIFTIGELAILFGIFNATESVFNGQRLPMLIDGAFAMAICVWQKIITRRIDYFVVNSGKAG